MKLRLIVAVAVAVVLAVSVGFSQGPQAAKLEGAWVARVVGTPSPVQWSYVLAPDPSGRRATLHGSSDLALGPHPAPTPGESASPLIGECVMTGPDTANCFVVWYGVQHGTPFDTLNTIGTVHSDVTMIAPGRGVVTHNFAIYAATADTDGDGLPEADATPLRSFTVTSHDTRIGLGLN